MHVNKLLIFNIINENNGWLLDLKDTSIALLSFICVCVCVTEWVSVFLSCHFDDDAVVVVVISFLSFHINLTVHRIWNRNIIHWDKIRIMSVLKCCTFLTQCNNSKNYGFFFLFAHALVSIEYFQQQWKKATTKNQKVKWIFCCCFPY